MEEKVKTQVAPAEQAIAPAAQATVPAVQPSRPRGLESANDPDDIIIPRAKLLQPGSPEIAATLPGQAPKNWAGQVVDSLTKEVLPMEFIPIIMKKEWIRFNPANANDPAFNKDFEPGAIIWRSSNVDDPRVQNEGKFGLEGEKPLATAILNFLCLFPGHSTPAVIGFKSSSYAAGKLLYNLIERSKQDAFASKYRLTIKQEPGPGNSTYYVLGIEPVGAVSEEEFKVCEQLWERFHAKPPKVDDEDENEASGPVDPARPY